MPVLASYKLFLLANEDERKVFPVINQMLIKHKTFKSPQKLVYLDLNSFLGDKPKNKNKIKLKSSHINIVQRTFQKKDTKHPV